MYFPSSSLTAAVAGMRWYFLGDEPRWHRSPEKGLPLPVILFLWTNCSFYTVDFPDCS